VVWIVDMGMVVPGNLVIEWVGGLFMQPAMERRPKPGPLDLIRAPESLNWSFM
jgi:hypothetical protein